MFEAIKAFFKFEKSIKQLAEVMEDSNKEMEALGEAFKSVTPYAQQLTFTSQETAAASQTLSQAGIKAEEAGKIMRLRYQQLLCKHELDFVFVWAEEIWVKRCNECALEEQVSELEALAVEYLRRQKKK